MSTWRIRAEAEAEVKELTRRIMKLVQHINSAKHQVLDVVTRSLLEAQLNAMKTYATLLQARLDISDDTPAAPSRATG